MQKLINIVALLSGLVSLSVVGGGAYLYLNKDVLIERARKNATEAVTKAVTYRQDIAKYEILMLNFLEMSHMM